MSVEPDIFNPSRQPPASSERSHRGPGRPAWSSHWQRPRRIRVRRLRLLFVLCGFGALAVISTLFGALTSIASDLPELENTVQFNNNGESYMYSANGTPIGPLAPAATPAIDNWSQISQNMVHAIVSVEDRGFWSESGISIRGLLRAGLADLTGGNLEGGSTIPEEFIKNVRQEEAHRTIGEKLIEAGMAFQLSHHWSHEKILTEYLNTIYFGNGALGIEAAARVYFGWAHGYSGSNPSQQKPNGCGDPDTQNQHRRECASELTPAQAALLAAMVANPSAFNPAGTNQERANALGRRNLVVLPDMYHQHYITYQQYRRALATPLPPRSDIQPPQESSQAPYFTSWVEPLVVRALQKEGLTPKAAQYEAYYGGLKVKLSLNLSLQQAAQNAVNSALPPGRGLPSASLVAINNANGEVEAMVSGDGDYAQSPFNLATMGYRQPGSAFKLFTLAAALTTGKYGPNSIFVSKPITIHFVKDGGNAFASASGTGRFAVRNFGDEYNGPEPLTTATAISDNSVFAQLGMSIGTARIKRFAVRMGIRSPVSTNPSMILGGLTEGVSALDLAHAYATEADGGVKITNPILGDVSGGPVGIVSISGCKPCHQSVITNTATLKRARIYSPTVAAEIASLLHGPVDDPYGTGHAAEIPGVNVAGKTGTTSNYVDAWFCGWVPQTTVCVWSGYPNDGRPMLTQFHGGPVEGGTFPAVIWRDYVVNALQILTDQAAHRQATVTTLTTATPSVNVPSGRAPTTSTPATTTTGAAATSHQTTATTAAPDSSPGTANAAPSSAPASSTSTPGSSAGPSSTTLPATASAPPVGGASTTSANGGSGL
ncbi:MAG: transglycosylase domain-containing protein [Solirubrobacteraceae bacterium]